MNVILDLMTLTLYIRTISIDYHHIRNKDKEKHKKRESWVIKVVNLILELNSLTDYTSTI